jgi:hypothetical protein
VIIGDGKFDPAVCYKLAAIDLAGEESVPCLPRCIKFNGLNKKSVSLTSETVPKEYSLFDAYPNPFNPITKIKFAIPKESKVNLSVYNMLGEKVKELVNNYLTRGFYEIDFDASELTSGIYIYKIETNNFTDVKKLMVVK